MTLDAFSPGSMTAERARLELRMTRETRRATRAFLATVATDAIDQHPAEFTAGAVHSDWDQVAFAMVRVAADVLGVDRPLNDEHLRETITRLRGAELPDLAYASARAVLRDNGGTKAMHAALSLDTPTTTLTAALTGEGSVWRSLIDAYARTEATITLGVQAIRAALAVEAPYTVWVAHHDNRTRPTHLTADGEREKPGGHFIVGGSALRYPGDPAGPYDETMGCRCVLAVVR